MLFVLPELRKDVNTGWQSILMPGSELETLAIDDRFKRFSSFQIYLRQKIWIVKWT